MADAVVDDGSGSSSWAKGLGFSITASLIGACSKLCIRRSYTLLSETKTEHPEQPPTTPQGTSCPRTTSSANTSSSSYLPYHQHCHDEQQSKNDHHETTTMTTTTTIRKSKSLHHSETAITEEDGESCSISDTSDDSLSDSDRDHQDHNHEQQQQQNEMTGLVSTASCSPADTPSSPSSSAATRKNKNISWLLRLQAFSLRAVGMFGMMVLGPMLNVYALQFASPSILSPVGGGLTLVWVVLLSECTIGEKPRQIQIVATAFIVVGEIVVAFAGDHVNLYALSLHDLHQQYFEDPKFISYLGCMILWMIVLSVIIRLSTNKHWKRFAWGIIGGSITGMQCFIKDALALWHGLDEFHNQIFRTWPLSLYVLLLIGGVIPFIGLMMLMACMKRYDATYTASMFMGSIVISSSIMSAVHYHTFDHLSTIQSILYLLGLVGMLIGTAILATEAPWAQKHSNGERDQPPSSFSSYQGVLQIDDYDDDHTSQKESSPAFYGSLELGMN